MLLDINKLKLKSDTDFFNALRLLEQLPVIQTSSPTFLEEKLMAFRAEVVEHINTNPVESKFDNQYLKKRALFHFFGNENIPMSDIISELKGEDGTLKAAYSSILFTRENIISLIGGGWVIEDAKYSKNLEKEILLKAKNSLPFNWLEANTSYDTSLPSPVSEEEKIKELSALLMDRYGLRAITLNSLDTAQEHINKLSTLVYTFESIAQNLKIEPKNIGMGKLDMHMGNVVDDCNGWMVYDNNGDNHIAIMQKANETIIIHEWMHWFDWNIQENSDFEKLKESWESHRNELFTGDFKKNKFDLKLFDKFSPESFINRFASNHINPVHKEEFALALSGLNTLFKDFVEKASNKELNISKENIEEEFKKIKKHQLKFMKKFGNIKYFPHEEFLHRYMSFLKADFEILNGIIQGTIKTEKSVFNYHADTADNEFGHHYSGNHTELTARSFEAYLEDTSPVLLPVDSHSTLWYPKGVERLEINKKWEKFLALAPSVMGSYYAPSQKEKQLLQECSIVLPTIAQSLLIPKDSDIINKRKQILNEKVSPVSTQTPPSTASGLKGKINRLRKSSDSEQQLNEKVKVAVKAG